MADVAITVKLSADEFQTLRIELRDHLAHVKRLREVATAGERRALMTREAQVGMLLEKLG